MNGQTRSNIKPGQTVLVVLKQDQATGKLTRGIVKDILTRSPRHPHGIKVRLENGRIGRVKEIVNPASEVLIRKVLPKDLDECFRVETSGFPPEEAANRETIKLRMDTFPQGFLVAEMDQRVVGILNSASTNKEDIGDEALKQLVGHEPGGRNMVVFALAVLPEFRKQGIARQLMLRFIDESRHNKKEKILLLCKQPLVEYYERLGFTHAGLSKSTHGGAEWHEMRYALLG